MTQMIVRPPQFFPDSLGNPAEGWRVYVGKPYTDPKQPANQLEITDGVGGEVASNPFFTSNGRATNKDGQFITPVIQGQEYSIRFESPEGGTAYEIPKFIGDGLGTGGGGTGGIPDETFNNLQQALATDLTSQNFIFIKAENSGWEGTATGADISSFYYRDGTVGAPSTGDANKFYDSVGNGWIVAISTVLQEALTQIGVNQADISSLQNKVSSEMIKIDNSGGFIGVQYYTPTFDSEAYSIKVFLNDPSTAFDSIYSIESSVGGNVGAGMIRSDRVDGDVASSPNVESNVDYSQSAKPSYSVLQLPTLGANMTLIYEGNIEKVSGQDVSFKINSTATSNEVGYVVFTGINKIT